MCIRPKIDKKDKFQSGRVYIEAETPRNGNGNGVIEAWNNQVSTRLYVYESSNVSFVYPYVFVAGPNTVNFITSPGLKVVP